MSKKSIFALIVLCISLTLSCKKEMGHYDEFYIINNSTHKVEYWAKGFSTKFDAFQDSISTFFPKQSKYYYIDSRGKGGGEVKEDNAIYPAPFHADSVVVCYDDTICITHKSFSGILPINNILDSRLWETNNLGEYQSQHIFTFTDEDYQEAFDNR